MQAHLRASAVEVPTGRHRFPWYGPGFVWIVASVGSGSVLFTPRVGARYEYALLWAAFVVMLLVWLVIREVGRYTMVSGRSILSGYYSLPGPTGWAVWFIFVPQLCASAVIVAGIAALVGSALMIALPGSQTIYALAITILSCVLVVSGQYKWIERVSTVMAGLLVASAFITAIVVRPNVGEIAAGLVPQIPPDFDLYFVIPWISFVVAGPAAVLWYSYWLIARHYGGMMTTQSPVKSHLEKVAQDKGEDEGLASTPGQNTAAADAGREISQADFDQLVQRLRGWLRIMATTAGIGVLGGGLVSVAFLILGAQLLAPQEIIPEGIRVAEDLSRMLADVWGVWGFWMLILGVVIALWGSIMANQDGFGRLYADATLLLIPLPWLLAALRAVRQVPRGDVADPEVEVRFRLKNFYSIVVLTVVPTIIFLAMRDPVRILSVGGVLAAAHMPVVVFLTLYLNLTRLPKPLRPSLLTVAGAVIAGGFYLVVAVIFFAGLLGGQ